MRKVTKAEFFKALYADQRDIMPHIASGWDNERGYCEDWVTNDSRRTLWGRSTSGRGYGQPDNKEFYLA